MNFDSNLHSWIDVDSNSDFPIQNIPFGVYNKGNNTYSVCSIIGDTIIDLNECLKAGLFIGLELPSDIFNNRYLNEFMALGKQITSAVRLTIMDFMKIGGAGEIHQSTITLNASDASLMLPIQIGDYTDFYSSIEHATNVGCLFRDPENALMPNWKHLPVGYHGRSSSMIVSGTDIHRPKGQMRPNPAEPPIFGSSKLMDFELEMGFVIGKETKLGDTISTDKAEDYIFGLMLFNDWSARDIQGWEYVPLGPFLGKNFASTLSPWVVTLEALEPFRVAGPTQDVAVLPYLQYEGLKNYDINLSVELETEQGTTLTLSNSNFKYMYWNMCQQLAHQTINGCNINVGDMYASGTISGPTPDSYGSLLELTWKGTKPIDLPDGTQRKFIQDNDTITLKGFGKKDGIKIGFGDVSGKILPSK